MSTPSAGPKPILLVSLGLSPAIVPEAFLFPEVEFGEVHVLTTASTDVTLVLEWFAEKAPAVNLTISRLSGFVDLTSEADHLRFEEVLYRWWLEFRESTVAEAEESELLLYACLSGGFKTMSTAVQKAAGWLGAAELFHVLCDLPQKEQPKTASEIEHARAGGHLHWIRLGAEAGWPQLRSESTAAYPLTVDRVEGLIRWVSAPDDRFRMRVAEMVARSHRVAEAWDQLPSLPFSALATWPGASLAWLGQPVDPDADRAWIGALPKVELHCHLGGFATHGATLVKVRESAESLASLPPLREPHRPAGWPIPDQTIPLTDYMRLGDANGSALLRDPGCLRRQCELLFDHFIGERILYAEVRCSPANYASPSRSPWTVLEEIRAHFQRCMDSSSNGDGAPSCHINLIIIATRREAGDYRAAISRHLALAVTAAEHWTDESQCRVVGVDLAGFEDTSTRAHYFRDEFTAVHRCGLALTVHAGENDDAEGIWRAVFDLSARRLGHALHLVDSPELIRSVADRGIGVEMCPYANFQIKGFPIDRASAGDSLSYPLKQYLDAGIRVTVNTDNIGISGAGLTENLLLAARLCPGLTRMDLLSLQSHALETAFISPARRLLLTAALSQRLPSP
jgi:adenosine deaminase